MAELLHRAIYLLGLDKQKSRIFVELFFPTASIKSESRIKRGTNHKALYLNGNRI